jgi:multimeric flavodoxin WrbA
MGLVLGLSASLRGSRHGKGLRDLPAQLAGCADFKGLREFLENESGALLEAFDSARSRGVPFDEMYRSLRRASGLRGLSNCEVALAAALWGAQQEGADIACVNLSDHFPETGEPRNLADLRDLLMQADGLVLSGPVYFGDRSSVAQEFMHFLYDDPALQAHLRGRVFGGLAVGAKRNGGQETTLIYQLLDMVNLGMLGVGNDAGSTSQYGGTVVAGDVGTAARDSYGLDTSVDTGRRVARVVNALRAAEPNGQADAHVAVWLLQDTEDRHGLALVDRLVAQLQQPGVRIEVCDFTHEDVHRCIACDICPVAPGQTEDYRCIVSSRRDLFAREHGAIIRPDAVLLAAWSPRNKQKLASVYQRFIERTRYLRRDDYAIGDLLTAPLVFSEIEASQNLHLRMLTSMVRHHTILHRPLLGFENHGEVLNWDSLVAQGQNFVDQTRRIRAARNVGQGLLAAGREYVPVGYEISAEEKRRRAGLAVSGG